MTNRILSFVEAQEDRIVALCWIGMTGLWLAILGIVAFYVSTLVRAAINYHLGW